MNAGAPPVSRRCFLGGTAALALGAAPVAQAEGAGDGATVIHWPTMPLVGGGTLYAKDWTGIAAIMVFWASWCPYCKRHNARIKQLFHALGDERIRILGVAMGDTEAQALAYVRANAIDFPVTVGHPDFRRQFSSRKVIPLTCLVRGDGRLVQVIPGELADADVLSLPSLLANRAA